MVSLTPFLDHKKYQFGNKKVLAEVRNGKLIVRVGGGWVPIEDFLRHFADELARDSPEVRQSSFKNLVIKNTKDNKNRRMTLDGFKQKFLAGIDQ